MRGICAILNKRVERDEYYELPGYQLTPKARDFLDVLGLSYSENLKILMIAGARFLAFGFLRAYVFVRN